MVEDCFLSISCYKYSGLIYSHKVMLQVLKIQLFLRRCERVACGAGDVSRDSKDASESGHHKAPGNQFRRGDLFSYTDR